MGQIRVMTPKDGDKSVTWDPENAESVKAAKDEFDKLKSDGHKLYKTKTTTTRTGEPVDEFDPSVGEYLAVPAMAGG